ncbi:MAG: hypothetical protein IPN33_24695 [Saprospiraceae bacterium]|nr:hypothetical protein [Saprospiraceae bacterium]
MLTYNLDCVSPGDQITITWTGGCPGWTVFFQLVRLSTLTVVYTFASNVQNNGSYSWTVPGGLDLNEDYQIYIQKSTAPFTWHYGDIFTIGGVTSFYADADGDGYGDPHNAVEACAAPIGFVADNTDCDDGNDQVYPGSGQPAPVCISNRIVSIGANGTYQLTPEQLLLAGELPCGASASLDVSDFDCADVTTIPSPRQNYSLAFDGTNEAVSITPPFSGTGNYTVEAWFKSENTGNCSGVNTYKRLLGWSTAQLEFADCGGILLFRVSGLWQSTTVNVRDNNWHHVAAVRQGNRHIVYVDGVKKLDFLQSPVNLSGAFYIGRGSSGSALWKGRIDECRIWNVARSQADIMGWKNKPLPGAQAGLVGYWNFDGGPGSNNLVSNIGGPSGTLANMEPASDWVSGAPLQYLAPIPVVATINNGGSPSICSSLITVVDAQAPVLQCKSSYAVAPGTTINVADLLDNPTTDNCGILFQGIDRSGFTCADIGIQNVTLTAVDINGNQATCIVPVSVQDGFQYICQDTDKELSSVGLALLNPSEVVTLTPSTCSNYNVSLSQTLFDCSDVGANTVTATISNGAGSTFTCSVDVTVNDVTPPVVNCQPFTLPLDAAGNATLTPQQVLSSATDACGIAGYSLDINQFDCSDVGQQAVILTATDNNGLSAFCTATVTISDNQGPVLNCQNATLHLDASGDATLIAAMVSPTITDNCGLAGTSLSQSAFGCSNITPEPLNYALNFTGTNNYYVAFASALTGPGNFTFETWFTDNNTGSVPKYLAGWQNAFFEILDINGLLYARFGNNSVNTNVNIRDGVWHHLAVTRSGSTVTIFLDGNIIWTGARNFNLSPFFQVGRRWSANNSTQGPWIGKIDEVRLWNTARTFSQILTSMSSLLQGAEPGLIGYWPMNEGPGNASAQDASPNNNHGVLSGVMSPATAWVGGAPVQSPGNVWPVTLTATDVNGLTSTCTVSVTVDDDLHPCCPAPVALCKNTTVSLGSGGTYTLLPSQIDDGSNAACGIQSMSSAPNALTCANAGVQSVTLTITDNNGATATCSSLVTVLGKPDISTTDAPIICFGDEFDLAGLNLAEATGMAYSLSYHHTSPATAGNELPSPVVAPLVTATYYVQAISAATSCKDELPVVVTVIPEPELEIYLYQSPQICQGEIYYLNGVGIEVGSNSSLLGYSWHYALPPTPDNEILNGDVSPSVNTTYHIAMLDGSGCTVIRNLPVVVNPGPDISVPAPAAICPGEAVDLAALVVTDVNNTAASLTYHSASPAGPGNELPSPLVSPATTTTYYIQATAPNGCKDEVPVSVTVAGAIQAECQDITVYLDNNGEYLLAASQIDDGSSSSCGSVTLSASPSLFSCSDLGDNIVTLTVTGPGGATAPCSAIVTVQAGDLLFGTGLAPQLGSIFSMDTDGNELIKLFEFERSPEAPYAPLIEGPDGFLYGTTRSGGRFEAGTIYRLHSDGSGYTVLHSFNYTNGANPYAGITIGADGFFYGTTESGGSSGYGTIYRLHSDGSGYTVLHSFNNTNGSSPSAGITIGGDGFLYGTTRFGGSFGAGTIYRLQSDGSGYTVLHSFNNTNGAYPSAGITIGADGFLYGTTESGGSAGYGTIYRLQSNGSGYTVLHSFNNTNGAYPFAGITIGTDGFLYGTTLFGGSAGYGTIYRLHSDGSDYTVLHSFNSANGAGPYSGITIGADGFLYGTTRSGGSFEAGTIYRLQSMVAVTRYCTHLILLTVLIPMRALQ